MTPERGPASVRLVMYARAVDEWEGLGLAALSLALAVAGTQVPPSLAVPLFLAVLAVGTLGVRALWRRWELGEGAAEESDGWVISEVRTSARDH
jgi:hypothetical protein